MVWMQKMVILVGLLMMMEASAETRLRKMSGQLAAEVWVEEVDVEGKEDVHAETVFVRKHPSSGEDGAGGDADIFDQFVGSMRKLSPSLVRDASKKQQKTMEVDADGNIKKSDQVVDSPRKLSTSLVRDANKKQQKSMEVDADGNVEISDHVSDSKRNPLPNLVRDASKKEQNNMEVGSDGSVEISDSLVDSPLKLSQSIVRKATDGIVFADPLLENEGKRKELEHMEGKEANRHLDTLADRELMAVASKIKHGTEATDEDNLNENSHARYTPITIVEPFLSLHNSESQFALVANFIRNQLDVRLFSWLLYFMMLFLVCACGAVWGSLITYWTIFGSSLLEENDGNSDVSSEGMATERPSEPECSRKAPTFPAPMWMKENAPRRKRSSLQVSDAEDFRRGLTTPPRSTSPKQAPVTQDGRRGARSPPQSPKPVPATDLQPELYRSTSMPPRSPWALPRLSLLSVTSQEGVHRIATTPPASAPDSPRCLQASDAPEFHWRGVTRVKYSSQDSVKSVPRNPSSSSDDGMHSLPTVTVQYTELGLDSETL